MKTSVACLMKNKSVRNLIVMVFSVEILFFALLIGYLAYNSGLHTIKHNADQVSAIVNDEIGKMLGNYLEDPYQIEQINKNAILNQQVDFANQMQRDKHFVEMLKTFPRVTNNYVVLASGDEYGARREDDGSFIVWNSNASNKTLDYYQYDERLGQSAYIKSLSNYEPCKRPSYLKGIAMDKPGWTDVYASATGRGLVVTKVCPLYTAEGHVFGVLNSSLLMNWIDDFLQSLRVTDHSSVYILSGKEEIIAAADGRVDSTQSTVKKSVLSAVENPQLFQGLSALKEKTPQLGMLTQSVATRFSFNGDSFYIYANPVHGKNDLQWTSVILIPETDLTYPLQDLVKQLLGITLIACLLGVITGIATARYIINPIVKVNQMAEKIAEGDFSATIEERRSDEIGQLIHSFNEMSVKLKMQLTAEKKATETERQMREQGAALNKAAGSFVPYGFLQMLGKHDITEITPGDHVEKEITVLFTDIRSYTKISENMSNSELFEFINKYLDLAVDVITINNGFIDKFIGDAIMGLFPDSSDDALRAIIELRRKMKQCNFTHEGAPIQTGAGIHFGSVMMGTVGTYARMDTTVLGDSVNLASRLESATKTYGVDMLISQAAYEQLQKPEQFNIREVDTVKVKGKALPIKIYEVFDCDPNELRCLKLDTLPLFAQALALYKDGDFARAEEIFRQCRDVCPEDQLLAVYIKRCSTLQRIPPGPDWKGISGI